LKSKTSKQSIDAFDVYKLFGIIGEAETSKASSHYLTKPDVKYKLIGSMLQKHYNYSSLVKLIGTVMYCDKNKPYDQQKLFELIGNKQ